jgi:ATP-binding cassette subfamily B multidrug efflux pump
VIKKILPCLDGYKKYAVLAPVTVTVEVILEIFIPLLMARIIDVGIAKADMSYVLKTGGLMVLMALCSLLCGGLSGKFAAIAAMGFAKGVRKRLFTKLQEFSFANIDKFSTASLVTRLTTDVTNTQAALMMLIRVLVRGPVMLISATIMACSINRRLVMVFLLAIPILGIAFALIAIVAFPRFRMMLQKYDRMNATVQENLIAIRVVKVFVRSHYEKNKFIDAAEQLRQAQVRAERIIALNMPMMQFTMYACMIAIVWFGGRMIIGGTMLTGELLSFISYVTQILMSLMIISMVFIGVVLSRASLGRIVEVLDEPLDLTDAADCQSPAVADGSVSFENVAFGYDKNEANPVLEDLNFTINSGETVGIIGGTGSAKSTLVQLIPRLYDVLRGRVAVGGHDVRDYSLATLRDAVAMVLQKNLLFSGTIKENLKWGNPAATEEQIVAACKAAEAHDFIRAFPDGYDTDLGQGGVNVSGGQKQRLCIARALLKQPKIIILDDSTSAVDTATDAKIRRAFRENLASITTIIVAQRISSVADADKIIVLNDGKIDAIGTHAQLLQSNQIYREVWESQQKGVAE